MGEPDLAKLSARLMPRVDELAVEMARRIRAAETDLAVISNEDVVASCAEQLRTSLAHLGGGTGPTQAARANARKRAQLGVPLAALLHSYRIGTRFLWECIAAETPAENAVLIEIAGELWLGLDRLSEAIREAYHEAEAERELRDRIDRDRMFDALPDSERGGRARCWWVDAGERSESLEECFIPTGVLHRSIGTGPLRGGWGSRRVLRQVRRMTAFEGPFRPLRPCLTSTRPRSHRFAPCGRAAAIGTTEHAS
ncbi:hypothetical protein ACFUAC_03345 [Streptomyces sp. NPDC057148]|uniref:hypothetical protein n=1 Tax=unclassified Streptomyces TaxID=2593676 RepID=UPI003637BD1B